MIVSPTRPLRLYLSALPEDMAGERALLLERVLPELRQRAGARGIEIKLSDPGAEPERWDLEARLRAIEACDIFLAFVGERCGEPLKALPYEVLPIYSWLDPSWSLLEIEIRAATLHALPLIENQALFLLRIPGGRSGFPAVGPEEAERMAGLKGEIEGLKGKARGGHLPVIDDYPAVWDEAERRAAGLEDLEKILQRSLAWAVEKAVADGLEASRSGPDYQFYPEERGTSFRVPPEPPPPLHEDVQFTVYRPRVVAPARWYKLLVFAHLQELPPDAPPDAPDPLEEVQRQALGLLGDQADSYGEVQQGSRHAIPHEAEITFVLEIAGFDVEPPRRTLLWLEAVQSETFRIRARTEPPDGRTARGRLTVFWGSLILAEMRLAIQVDRRAAEVAVPPQEREAVRPFRKIFASYSQADRVIVDQCERWVHTVGDQYLRDIRDLRAGEIWTERLEELIREADVFQLFWSWNAMKSQYVEREWRYALGLGRPYFVRPTFWEKPLPAAPDRGLPPPELLDLHFQPIELGGTVGSPPSAPDRSFRAGPHSEGEEPSVSIGQPTQAPIQRPAPASPPISVESYGPSPGGYQDLGEPSLQRSSGDGGGAPMRETVSAGCGCFFFILVATALVLLLLLSRS